jgi:predicted NBD/HSP70 family sugar kinase
MDKLKQKLKISTLESIGVTIAGLINPSTGTVLVAPNLGWKNVQLGDIFREHQKKPCTIKFQNDAEASALAELWFGEGEINNFNNFVFVSVGAGLGTGIVINRKVFEGHSYAAGEFGHLNIFGDGEPCVCGSSGCWEAYASDRATVKRYLKQKGLSPTPSKPVMVNDVIEAAQAGEKTAITVLKETGVFLGIGISNIIRALDPPAIVIGGHILQAWDLILDDLIAGISRRGFFDLEKQVKVLPSSLKERPRLIGAATLALEQIFSDYKITR